MGRTFIADLYQLNADLFQRETTLVKLADNQVSRVIPGGRLSSLLKPH